MFKIEKKKKLNIVNILKNAMKYKNNKKAILIYNTITIILNDEKI